MKTLLLLVIIAMTNVTLPVWAADISAPHDMSMMAMNPTKEDREKMAVAHSEMASCLRSGQEFTKCHEALHKECKTIMGGSCPGMEMGDGMKGMKHKK